MSQQMTGSRHVALLQDRNFRWFVGGGIISMLGDQFTLIGIPWLVLKMTGNTVILATVLALLSLPRALFILVGGALVDQYSSKKILMLSKQISAVLLGILCLIVWTGNLQLWAIYVIAFAIGIASAFGVPAGMTVLAQSVKPELVQVANSMGQSLRQVTTFAGPLLAGAVITLFNNGGNGLSADISGLTAVFLFDAFSFILSAWTLSYVNLRDEVTPATKSKDKRVWTSIREGVRYCWNDRAFRNCFLYWAAVAFFIGGPMQIAMPVIAAHYGYGAGTFGGLVGMQGGGVMIGMIISGIKPNFRVGNLGTTILLADGVVGALFVLLGSSQKLWHAMLILFVIGIVSGYLQVIIYTWMQKRTPMAMIGRITSIFMFIVMAVSPLSATVSGIVLRNLTPSQLFVGCGSILVMIAITTLFTSKMEVVTDGGNMPKAGHGR